MTTEQIRKFHQARPFLPFEIYLADGRSVKVNHPEMLALGGRTIAVFDEPEAAEIIDLLLVTSLKPQKSGAPSTNGH
jgi:hypothetical protein